MSIGKRNSQRKENCNEKNLNEMKNCKHIRALLPLFEGEELTAIEKRQVDDHLTTCPRCREELAAIRSLHADLLRTNVFEPSETMLADLRHSLRRRLRQESLRPNWQEKLGSLLFGNFRPIWQLGFSAAILLIGIFLGRQFFQPSPATEKFDVLAYLSPGKLVAIPSGYVAPSLGDVQTLRFDPATKQVEIHFSMVNDVQLRGSVNDPAIRMALSQALREPDQPNLRLKAVKALGETYVTSNQPMQNDELTETLLYVLENDPNAGVRLKVAQVLKQLPLNGLIKNSLIHALLRDENPAVRIEAIEALNRGSLTEEELAPFHAAEEDSNAYIRLQVKRLLSGQSEEASGKAQPSRVQ